MSALVISGMGQALSAPATARATASTGRVSAPLRLTRRGRMVFLGIPALAVTAVLVFIALAVVLGSIASPANASVKHAPVSLADYAASVTVLQGDSLWSIAAKSDPTRDIRDVVREIVAMNELNTGVVQAGQRLFVPLPK